MTSHNDRVVVITGAGRGIATSVAERFARDGARVAVADLVRERAEATAAAIVARGGIAHAFACDVRSSAAVRTMIDAVVAAYGRIDVLVNAAGAYVPYHMAHETTDETWDVVLDSNLKGTFFCCRAALPYMMQQRSGRIINFASNAARSVATALGCEYTAAKTGMLGLTRHLAKEYAPYGILVNTLAPGPTDVPRVRDGASEEQLAGYVGLIPLGRLGRPEEQAEVVFFLASAGAGFITGATIDSNGGIVMA
jgi:NAD(P)-dependent dehydrogenase (short-subunit alcohol dehydrogenase family)